MSYENNFSSINPSIVQKETFLGDAREFCEQQKLEEIKNKKYLDPLYDAAFKAFLNDEQALLSDEERAERESRRYEIPPTFAIWICDFVIQQQDDYRGDWAIRNEKGLTISDKVKYIIYDLTRFNKAETQIKTDEDRWLFLLKHAGSAQSLPDFGDETIAKAIRRILVDNASETLLREQVKSMVLTEEELDYLAWIKMKGVKEKAREIATKMLLKNKPLAEVIEFTGLPESEVLSLKTALEQK